jgi:Ca-activated chloride channel homolog
MTDFRFAQPLALLLPFLFLGIRWLISRFAGNDWAILSRYFHQRNLALLFPSAQNTTSHRLRSFLFGSGLILLSIAAARPQANPQLDTVEQASLDIYVLLDVSRSMDAEDLAPSRLRKAKRSIENLTKLLSGDRVGIIAFAGSAVIVSPLTSDYEVISSFLQSVDTSVIENQGTDVGKALELAHTAMKRGAERVGGANRSNVFVVMSDGEDHEKADVSVADRIRADGGLIYTIAFGTERGAPIPVRTDGITLQAYKRDQQGNQVVTKVQPKVLEELAAKGGGKFYFSTVDEGEIRDLVAQMQNMQRTGAASVKAIQYEEFFQLPLLLGILALAFALGPMGSIPFLKRRKSALASKIMLLLLSFHLFPAGAWALNPPSWLADSERKAFYEAEALIKEGKAEEAALRLAPLLAENPKAEDIRFNVGSMLAEGGKKEEGQKQLDALTKESKKLSLEAAFNSAGASGKEKKNDEVRARYAELLWRMQQAGMESPLNEKIKNNLLALAEESKNQKNQDQNQPSQGGGEGQNKDQQQPQNSAEGDSKSESKADSQKDQQDQKPAEGTEEKDQPQEQQGKEAQPPPEQGNEPPRRGRKPFKEQENLSEADAKNILETLNQREGNLQKKFLKRKEPRDRESENDDSQDW